MKSDLSTAARNQRAVAYIAKKHAERIERKAARFEAFVGVGIPVVFALGILIMYFLR
jgi:hypothetical protein